jgi:hypothetical protein
LAAMPPQALPNREPISGHWRTTTSPSPPSPSISPIRSCFQPSRAGSPSSNRAAAQRRLNLQAALQPYDPVHIDSTPGPRNSCESTEP